MVKDTSFCIFGTQENKIFRHSSGNLPKLLPSLKFLEEKWTLKFRHL